MNYKIVELTKENAHDYAYVNSRAWLESYKGIVDEDFLLKINTAEDIAEFTEKLKGNVDNNPDKQFLLYLEGKAVGVLGIRKPKYEGFKDCGELGAIYLLNEAKGKGLGRILFEYAKYELKKMGYKKMVNGCINGNPANEFYKHMGGKYVKTIPFTIKKSGQELEENIYYYESI